MEKSFEIDFCMARVVAIAPAFSLWLLQGLFGVESLQFLKFGVLASATLMLQF